MEALHSIKLRCPTSVGEASQSQLVPVCDYFVGVNQMGCLCRLDVAPNLAETCRMVERFSLHWIGFFLTTDGHG